MWSWSHNTGARPGTARNFFRPFTLAIALIATWTAPAISQTHRYNAAIEGAGKTHWLSFIPTRDIAQVDYDLRLQEKDPAPLLQFSAVMHAESGDHALADPSW